MSIAELAALAISATFNWVSQTDAIVLVRNLVKESLAAEAERREIWNIITRVYDWVLRD